MEPVIGGFRATFDFKQYIQRIIYAFVSHLNRISLFGQSSVNI